MHDIHALLMPICFPVLWSAVGGAVTQGYENMSDENTRQRRNEMNKTKTSSKKILSTAVVAAIIVLFAFTAMCATVSAATEDEIEQAIEDGLAYLASTQNPADGSWGIEDKPARTAIVLMKFEDRAKELGKDPFDNDPTSDTCYEYADNVIAGMNYLLSQAYIVTPLPTQIHGVNNDNPDSNGNGQGIAFGSSWHQTYTTGLALCALSLSAHPDDRSYTIGVSAYTYKQIAQDAVDWLAFAQSDSGNGEGGWSYSAIDNADGWPDNSNSGYATLGLDYAEEFGCTVLPWVKDELNSWIDYIQNDVDDPVQSDDGGSGYGSPDDGWVNILKTGNLIQQMAFYSDNETVLRVQDALSYLERHWRDANNDPGWGYSQSVSAYQAMFTTMKGLETMGVDLLDTDGDGNRDNDWFNQEPPVSPAEDFASVLVAQQITTHGDINSDGIDDYGSWPQSNWDYEDNRIISTAWALLTLEKIAPPPEMTPGKVTGGGQIEAPVQTGGKKVDKASFGFNVMYQETDPAPKGELEYLDHATGMNVHAHDMTRLVVSDDKTKAWFEGTCTIDGVSGFTFEAYVEDNNEPGKKDRFEITFDSYSASGELLSGNIQIHKKP